MPSSLSSAAAAAAVVVVEYNIIYIIIIVGAVGPRLRYNPLFFTVYSLHDLAKRMVS